MDSISQKEIEYLRKNKNTGIEFEYALFYLLNSDKGKSIFLNSPFSNISIIEAEVTSRAKIS